MSQTKEFSQYSTDNGNTWVTIDYFNPDTNSCGGQAGCGLLHGVTIVLLCLRMDVKHKSDGFKPQIQDQDLTTGIR